ncbi:hypothetical protein [Ralstonia pseudosolanacearum]|uniref:hypothetical protein n=1 Tax=Ralstonia pseudosolanacearum TaxID=1310165 RepID=UPI00156F617E|nr:MULTISPECIES: hypothetical protein [Ralstonia]MDO3517836.1 hypothetical protein [Ralstonia pseudosolanacearum]QKM23137.1 hypothetical protein HI796_08390 [Ralstonia solanacearum]QKM27945.1 hypothetical protein HI795_08395 [Ralstonia solanacearum]UZF33542.1 hypothetical protein LGV81_09525 [Ralstonia sp. RS647]
MNAKLAVSKVIDTKYTGLIAEHIGAYYCLEEMKWGTGWQAHDRGGMGHWQTKPSETVLGRLDSDGKLEQLLIDSEKGHGIDAVWRATPINNDMHPYAIVEIKGSLVDKELKTPGRQKDVSSKLGTIKDAAKDVALDAGKVAAGQVDLVPPAPPGDMLLEPELDERAPAQPGGGAAAASGGGKATGGGSRPSGRKNQRKTQAPAPKSAEAGKDNPDAGKDSPEDKTSRGVIIQMSHEWIKKNLSAAVGKRMDPTIRSTGYARHLLYIPFFLPRAGEHVTVWYGDGPHHEHTKHDLPARYHYHDKDVEAAVRKKAKRLAKRMQT